MSETNFSIPYGCRSPLEHERDTDDTGEKAIETLIAQARWSNDHAAGMTLCAHEVALVITLAADRDRLRAGLDATPAAPAPSADVQALVEAANQARLAFAGYVSVQSAIDKLDAALAAMKGGAS